MDLSIILPVYNCEKFLSKAIESILNQTFTDFELIIADDGSTDRSKKIIEKYAKLDNRIIVSNNSENQGKVKTVNRLVEITRGKYLTVHDADDWSDPERFEKQVCFLDNNPNYVMCGTSFKNFDENDEFLNLSKQETDYFKIKNTIRKYSQFHGPTLVIRKKILPMVGGLYRDYFIVAEDIDFTQRVVEKFFATNLSEPLYNYRIHSKSLTKKAGLYKPSRYAIGDLMVYLQKQRDVYGEDLIWNNQYNEEVEKFFQEKVSSWNRNSIAIYEDGISRSLNMKLHKVTFLLILKVLIFFPFKLKTYRIIGYSIRSIFKRMR